VRSPALLLPAGECALTPPRRSLRHHPRLSPPGRGRRYRIRTDNVTSASLVAAILFLRSSISRCEKGERNVKTRSWIGRMTFPAVAGVIALTVTLLAAAGPSVAQTMSMHESATRGGDAHHGADGDHGMHSSGEHGDWDHHAPHHFRGRPNEPYYI